MNNSSITLYERDDLIRQATKEKKYGPAFHIVTYAFFMMFALVVDYMSIAPFEDLILKTNMVISNGLSLSIIFCIDIIVPISLTRLIQAVFEHDKLNRIMMAAISLSIGIPLVLLIIQKLVGINILMPDQKSDSLKNIPIIVKIMTQCLFSFVPVATTVALTVMGLLRSQVIILRRFRYLQLAEARASAQYDELMKAIERDKKTLQKRDDSKFVSTLTELFAMRNRLFTMSRYKLAKKLNSPEATEMIMGSKPVYQSSDLSITLSGYVMNNPAVHVCFEQSLEAKEGRQDNHFSGRKQDNNKRKDDDSYDELKKAI